MKIDLFVRKCQYMSILLGKKDTTFSIQDIRKTCRIGSNIDLLSRRHAFHSNKGHVFRFNQPN
ncbi:hypothetical protein AT267_28500 [Bacillus cereus]|nr:hypothetical protein AT267_28500 [Bacillus cereus]